MSENIEYIVDAKGNKIKAIISLELLSKITSEKSKKTNALTKEKLKAYAGIIKLKTDPVEFQRNLRDEWK